MTVTEWTERYEGAVMNTFGPPQTVLVRGEGSRVWDADGKEYLDLLGGIAVNALGHAHPAIVEAVTTQLHDARPHLQLLRVRAADRPGREASRAARSRRVGSSSPTRAAEANEAAFKATRRTGRTKVVVAEGSFHGRTMGALALTSKEAYRAPFEPLPGDVTWVPYGDAAALEAAVDETVAAVLLEPIQGEAGVIDAARRLPRRRPAQITTKHGALLWLDEVQTGIGRTGAWFAHEQSGVVPDLVTVAKGLGGGIPIGACIALGDAATLLQPGNHGTTFGGNPVATAAALAVISTIESDKLLDHVTTIGDQLRRGLERPSAGHRARPARDCWSASCSAEPIAADVAKAALAAGLIINAPTPDRLRLAPPLILTEDEAAHAVTTLRAVLDEVRA